MVVATRMQLTQRMEDLLNDKGKIEFLNDDLLVLHPFEKQVKIAREVFHAHVKYLVFVPDWSVHFYYAGLMILHFLAT